MGKNAGVDHPQIDEGLPCVNCRQKVGQVNAKFFDGVFLCPSCHGVALRVEERLTSELKMLLVMLREAIRVAACDGKLHLSDTGIAPEASKKDVLEAVLQLTERKEARKKVVPGA
jgi:hypothetical protein